MKLVQAFGAAFVTDGLIADTLCKVQLVSRWTEVSETTRPTSLSPYSTVAMNISNILSFLGSAEPHDEPHEQEVL